MTPSRTWQAAQVMDSFYSAASKWGFGSWVAFFHTPPRDIFHQVGCWFSSGYGNSNRPRPVYLSSSTPEKGIFIGVRMNARLPLLINLPVTLTAGFGLEARQAFGNLLEGNRVRILGPEPENDDRFHLRVIEVHQPRDDREAEQQLQPPFRDATSARMCRSTEAAKAVRL